jgi:hypothetical protein
MIRQEDASEGTASHQLNGMCQSTTAHRKDKIGTYNNNEDADRV